MLRRADKIEEKIDMLISAVSEIKTSIAVISESQKNMSKDIEMTANSVKAVNGRVDQVVDRVDSLEKFKVRVLTYASLAGGIIASAGNWIWGLIVGNKH